MTTKYHGPALLALGVLLGAAIWVFSPWLTGKIEPWDADRPIWPLSWLVIAFLGGLTGRISGVCLPLGYALGQALVTIKSVFAGQFGALGWMFIGGYAAVAAAATVVLAGAIMLVKYLWRRRGTG